MKPISDRVIIIPDEQQHTTSGGIIIPNGLKELPASGTVVSVGRNKDGSDSGLKEGDKVVYNKYAATDFEHDGEAYKVLRIDEVYYKDVVDYVQADEWVSNQT